MSAPRGLQNIAPSFAFAARQEAWKGKLSTHTRGWGVWGFRQSQKQEIAFLDAFVSWRDMTIIWMTRSALEPSAHATLSEKDQSFLTELGATVLHVRLTTDVSNSKVKGADATLKVCSHT